MEEKTLQNPYTRAAKILLAKRTLTAEQLGRLVFLNFANNFWTSLYNQPYQYLYEEVPLDKYQERTQEGQNYVNAVYFVLDWLRCFCLYRYSYEAQAIEAANSINIFLVEARKNEESKARSNRAKNVINQLRGLLDKLGYNEKPTLPKSWKANLDLPPSDNPLYYLDFLERTLEDVDASKDGYQFVNSNYAREEAREAREEADRVREAYEDLVSKNKDKPGVDQTELEEMEGKVTRREAAADKAEEAAGFSWEERTEKEALLDYLFSKLAEYILFLRGTRIFMEELAKHFKTTPEAFVSKEETLNKILFQATDIVEQLAVFTSFKYEGKPTTLEEADRIADRINQLKEYPGTWKEYRQEMAKIEMQFDKLDLDGFADIAEPWETKCIWRKLAITLNKALTKEWRPKDRAMAKLRISRFSFCGTPSDMDYLHELCGTKTLGF